MKFHRLVGYTYATKGDCGQVEFVCWPWSIHVPYFFHAYHTYCRPKSFFTIGPTIDGTLKYKLTKFRAICLRIRCVCGKSSCLKTSVSPSSILSAVRAVRGRPLPGRRFIVPIGIRSILLIILSNPLRDQVL